MKKVICFLSLFFCLGSVAHAAESTLNLAPPTKTLPSESLVAGSNSNSCSLTNTWKPYFVKTASIQAPTSTFVQTNVGIGFLYFSGLRGNLQPSGPEAQGYAKTQTPIQRGLNYNKTPVYEWMFGYQANNWFSAALTYQSQTNVGIYSHWQNSPTAGAQNFVARHRFQANLNLYGLALRAYFTLPYTLMFKMMAFSPFASVGVGPCWQTWYNMNWVEISGQGRTANAVFINYPAGQKISANCMFIADIGFKTQWMVKKFSFSVIKGFKFNIWGQARSIGKESQQDFATSRFALSNPIRIRTVYQFAPYLGLQWNY